MRILQHDVVVLLLLPFKIIVCVVKFVMHEEELHLESKIEVLSTVKLSNSPDLYKIVDSLNRTLKKEDLMFGLALDKEDQNTAIFTIYRT